MGAICGMEPITSLTMHTVDAFEAIAKIAELLDEVAAGETVLITRRGEAAALLVPPTQIRKDKARALSEIKRFRKACKTGKVDIEALIDADRP
jgi:prevent-host-death family protein